MEEKSRTSVISYLAGFVGSGGTIARAKDPQLADFLTDIYEEGAKIAAKKFGKELEEIKGEIADSLMGE
jgi:hypothetical protein